MFAPDWLFSGVAVQDLIEICLWVAQRFQRCDKGRLLDLRGL